MLFMLLIGMLLISVGIQFRRGKWYRLIAGNTFNDKPIKIQKNAAKGASNIAFIVGALQIVFFIFIKMKLNTRLLIIVVVIPLVLYAFYMIFHFLKDFIKNG